MAKSSTIKIRLVSTADTGYFYVTKKNTRTKTEKLSSFSRSREKVARHAPDEGRAARRGGGSACNLGLPSAALSRVGPHPPFGHLLPRARGRREGVRAKIRANKGRYRSIFVLYGDCGTGGLLDRVLEEEGVERIAGPHCYAFFSGNEAFAAQAEDEITAFYLTDYLARHFDKLVWQGLGMADHPELLPMYFGNYTKLVYLAQTRDPRLQMKARAAAAMLGLEYEYRETGYGELESGMRQRA
jgi:hypothetical protein